MTRRAGNLVALAAGLGAAMLAAEVAVRLLWKSAPAVLAADTLPLARIKDPDILYRLIPNSSGTYNGTRVEINGLGLRDHDYSIPAREGTTRVLVLGDSMVFGVGLPPELTLPGRLSKILSPGEAINAGIFGYNLRQEIALLRDVGAVYRPDIVVSCFVHNDVENWGLGEDGAVPEIKSSRFSSPPADAWSSRLAALMLPDEFNTERLNLLPEPGAGGLRHGLASISRLYLFTYLRLKTHSWSLTGGESVDPLIASPVCEADLSIWGPLAANYRLLARTASDSGAKLMVVILGGWMWEGAPLAKLHALLREEGIPFLDLTPVWHDRELYAKEYSLGWDPHPNATASELSAELIAAYLTKSRLMSHAPGDDDRGAERSAVLGPHDVLEERPDLRDRLSSWKRRQSDLVQRQQQEWTAGAGHLKARLDVGARSDAGGIPRPILYGFWETPDAPPPPSGNSGLWMSGHASVLLAPASGASELAVELELPSDAAALQRTPETLRVTLGAPPSRCDVASLELPVARTPGPMTLRAALPAAVLGANPLEVRLWVDRPFAASYLRTGLRDPRLVSYFVRSVSVQ
ncbi:MAG TPA: hypothetical protein VFG76_13255 [Candidatus Polarisedimenticolia bacterium]|nr:hypothetical protein [Candidatus Polarisedimenticolia bacterium]